MYYPHSFLYIKRPSVANVLQLVISIPSMIIAGHFVDLLLRFDSFLRKRNASSNDLVSWEENLDSYRGLSALLFITRSELMCCLLSVKGIVFNQSITGLA